MKRRIISLFASLCLCISALFTPYACALQPGEPESCDAGITRAYQEDLLVAYKKIIYYLGGIRHEGVYDEVYKTFRFQGGYSKSSTMEQIPIPDNFLYKEYSIAAYQVTITYDFY